MKIIFGNIDKKVIFINLLVLLLINYAKAQSEMQLLKENINKEISKVEGTIAMAFKRLDVESPMILINESIVFHAASTMKTPIMLKLMQMVENEKIELHDKVLIKNKFKSIVDGSDYQLNRSDDSDDFMYENIGKSISIEELIYRMMTVSSNLATNMLIEICQPQEIMDFLRINNINGFQILRGVEDTKAFRAGLNNETTALGMLSMFEYIDRLPSGISKTRLMNILFDQKFNDIIPAKIPKDVKVAHKTGSIVGVQHDTGIVYLPDGKKYAMILLSKQLKDEKKGIEVLSNISKMVYEYVAQ